MPIKLVSPNVQLHWTKRYKLNKKTKQLITAYWVALNPKPTPPCKVTFIRYSPRQFDKEDNLPMSLKAIKDQVADLLVPNLAAGRADGDSRIMWEYVQVKKSKTQILEIVIEQN